VSTVDGSTSGGFGIGTCGLDGGALLDRANLDLTSFCGMSGGGTLSGKSGLSGVLTIDAGSNGLGLHDLSCLEELTCVLAMLEHVLLLAKVLLYEERWSGCEVVDWAAILNSCQREGWVGGLVTLDAGHASWGT
jgi:hypothetical protein